MQRQKPVPFHKFRHNSIREQNSFQLDNPAVINPT